MILLVFTRSAAEPLQDTDQRQEIEADIPKKTTRGILFGKFGKAHKQMFPSPSARTTVPAHQLPSPSAQSMTSQAFSEPISGYFCDTGFRHFDNSIHLPPSQSESASACQSHCETDTNCMAYATFTNHDSGDFICYTYSACSYYTPTTFSGEVLTYLKELSPDPAAVGTCISNAILTVCSSQELIDGLNQPSVVKILLRPGVYNTIDSAAFTITHSVILAAEQPGTAILQSSQTATGWHRVLVINAGKVELSGINIAYGGGLSINGGNVQLYNCNIHSNTATSGGGAYIDDGIVTFTDCSIYSNTADNYSGSGYSGNDGGGLRINGGNVQLDNCNIHSNTATYGGGAYIGGGTVTFNGCNIYSNLADYGGGVFILSGTVTFTSCNIYNNQAEGYGGAAYIQGTGTKVMFTNCKIYWNSADYYGGGAYISGNKVTFTNCEINGNEAAGNGGGAYIYGGRVTFTNCEISGNEAAGNGSGGGAYIGHMATVTSYNSAMFANSPNDKMGNINAATNALG